jgi:hypothetical protein
MRKDSREGVIRTDDGGEKLKAGNAEEYDGYCIDLLKLLQQDLNFTYDLFLVEDNKFGSVDNNGNWDGMIGALVNGKSINTFIQFTRSSFFQGGRK